MMNSNKNDKNVTGIGSREVTEKYKERVIEIAKLLDAAGYTLRSGGADGCDTLFEENMSRKKIYLPWKNFNKNKSRRYMITPEAIALASEVHPAFQYLSQGAQKLHARNCYQVLGYKLNHPSEMVVCYTKDGCNSEASSTKRTGGTRTAIVIADRNNIPVYNLKNDADYEAVKERLNEEIKKV